MALLPKLRAGVALLLSACLLCPSALALVTFNDGKEHLFVTGTASVAYDSNLFAHAGGGGDTVYSAGLVFEYTRRAGWIGVNASVALNLSQFVDHSDQNFLNPRFEGELTKTSGRTTGSLNLSAARENRADTAANLREESWDYMATLNFRYPVIERYSISGSLGYNERVYGNTVVLSNLRTYTASLDLLYALNSQRDLTAGYRYRYSETSRNTAFDDSSFTIGVSGKIIPRLNGVIRAGYEIRHPSGRTTDGDYKGLTASGALTFTASKKFSMTGQVSKDVSVTSTDISVDSLSANLEATYVFNARISLFANVGGGRSRFLGAAGAGRRDEDFTFGGGVNYTMRQHLTASLAYQYFQNWSTLSYSDFDRNTVTLSLSSRW